MAEGTLEVAASPARVTSPKALSNSKPSTPTSAAASPKDAKTKTLLPKVASSTAATLNGVKEAPGSIPELTKQKSKSPALSEATPTAALKSDKDASLSPASPNSLSFSKAPSLLSSGKTTEQLPIKVPSPSSSGKTSVIPKPTEQSPALTPSPPSSGKASTSPIPTEQSPTLTPSQSSLGKSSASPRPTEKSLTKVPSPSSSGKVSAIPKPTEHSPTLTPSPPSAGKASAIPKPTEHSPTLTPSPPSSGKASASSIPAEHGNAKVERTSSKRNTRSKNSLQEVRKGSDGSQKSLIGKDTPSSTTGESKQANNQATSSNPAKFGNYSNTNEKSKKKQTKQVDAANGEDSEDDIVPDKSVTKRQTIDVSQFLDVKSFSNSVEIAVNNSKFTCSGAVLAYHSPVMASILMKGANIITLDKLCTPGADIAIEESLILLYGGGAVITISNIETMTKFSVLYQVENLYRLCCEWIRHYVSVENIYDMWLLGNIDYIAAKQTRRKNNIVHICRNFIKDKECEIALELRKRKKAKVEIQEGFLLMMLQCTEYSTMFSDLL